jgi:hypothetical protein
VERDLVDHAGTSPEGIAFFCRTQIDEPEFPVGPEARRVRWYG